MAMLDAPFQNDGGGGFNMGGIGQIAGGIGQLFNYENPADSADPYLEKIKGEAGNYLDPYAKAGANTLPGLQEQFMKLINNPQAMMKMFAGGYKESPGFQFNVDQATKAAKNMAAAGGMLGSQASQENLAGTVNGLASQDFNQYLQNMMKTYGMGLEGQGNIAGMGMNASNNMANIIAQQRMAQAQNAYAGQANENNNWSNAFGNIAGGLMSFV